MKCINHLDHDAVGVCTGCGKGVCENCVVSNEESIISCSDDCSLYGSRVKEMNRRGMKLYGIGTDKKLFPMAALMWGLFAVLFIGFSIFRYMENRQLDWFIFLFGIICLFFTFYSYKRNKELQLNC